MRRAAGIAMVMVLLLSGCMSRKEMEDTLRQDLLTMRAAIDQYTSDKQQAPQTLDDLVRAGYLKEIPKDPCTGKRDWMINSCEHYKAIPDNTEPGICDVHSACRKENKGGAPYKDW
jgi:general secretion pathway protein G